MQTTHTHITVLREPAVNALLGDLNGTYIDATYGRGGHTALILQKLLPNATLLAFDQDLDAIAHAQTIQDTRFKITHKPFSHITHLAPNSVDGILFDLGVSSPQFDDSHRGFSFRYDAPLDMRMDTTRGKTVAHWLNEVNEEFLTEVIDAYGEERFARAIAKAIIARRQTQKPIQRTGDLAQLVASVVKTREKGQHPATRTFQSFRIYINSEIKELQEALNASLTLLKTNGKLVVISFHSLEDRLVKQFINKHSKESIDRKIPTTKPINMPLKNLGRIKPTEEEIRNNPRARSAIMRIAQKVV